MRYPLSKNFTTLTNNTVKAKEFIPSIFVISNDTVMKAIEHIKNIGKKIIHLFYSVCTNDLIVYSKQASNIEIFVLAFFIECNRIFIADSIYMNILQKHVFVKINTFVKSNNCIQYPAWVEMKNSVLDFIDDKRLFGGLYVKEEVVN